MKRFPASILWTAFLSMSNPASCILSASSRCDNFSLFLKVAMFSPQMLFFPVFDLLINTTFPFFTNYLDFIYIICYNKFTMTFSECHLL